MEVSKPVTREELISLIEAEDWKAVEDADVSQITNMFALFKDSEFNEDISN